MTQSAPYKVTQKLPQAVESELVGLLYEGEVQMLRRCESKRKDLVRRHDFSTYACFRAVDDLNEGEINAGSIRGFLKQAGHFPTEEEVAAIVRRIDSDADSRILYGEFSEAIKPQEFSASDSLNGTLKIPFSYREALTTVTLEDTKASPLKFTHSSPLRLDSPLKQVELKLPIEVIKPVELPPVVERIRKPISLKKVLRKQVAMDREVEKLKQDLVSSCLDFNLFDAFRLLDKSNKRFVRISDMLAVLQDVLWLKDITSSDIEVFFRRFDLDGDLKSLNFSELSSAFTPSDDFTSRMLEGRSPNP